jgi:type IV pilus assembly protein PilA
MVPRRSRVVAVAEKGEVMKNASERGFTLIELMIVVAIVGILAALAIPLYQDYLIRSRVIEGVTLVVRAKETVAQNAMTGSPLDAAWSSPAATSNLSDIQIDGTTGAITLSFTARAGAGTLVFIPTSSGTPLVGTASSSTVPTGGSIQWDCASSGSLPYKYRPANCRV